MARLTDIVRSSLTVYNEYIEESQPARRRRNRLRASEAGEDCARNLWYQFRWVFEDKTPEARYLRIFDVGHWREEKIIEGLRGAGFGVLAHDQATKMQVSINFADGFGVGYLDGIISGLIEAPKAKHVLEIKTAKNTDYNAVIKHGVKKHKPLHYAQMQMGMHGTDIDRALYVIECKNTSNTHFERVEYDMDYCLGLEARMVEIAFADEAPPRFYDDPDKYPCTFCDFVDLCWLRGAKLPDVSCRTCAHITPISGGKWHCSRHGNDLTFDDQQDPCAHHRFNPSMMPGDVVKVSEDQDPIVTYQLCDGSTYEDGEI